MKYFSEQHQEKYEQRISSIFFKIDGSCGTTVNLKTKGEHLAHYGAEIGEHIGVGGEGKKYSESNNKKKSLIFSCVNNLNTK
jgi:hypothetical protein